MRGKRLGLVLAAAGMLTAAACGGAPADRSSSQGGEDGKTDSGQMQAATDPDAPAPAPQVEGAKKGGTITVTSSSTSVHTFDPTRTYYIDAGAILKLVTRTLTQYQYRDGQMVLVPDLATDLGQPNKDFTEWKFTLRDGIKYEDGTEVTSEDLAYAVKRQFATEELPDGPIYGIDYYLDGDKYKGPFKDGDNFRGVETPDDKTLIIKMRKPFADLPFYAAFPNFSPIPQDKDTKQDYGNHPLSTGPYKFEDYNVGKELTLTRNENWDANTDTTRHQYVDKWVFKFAQDPQLIQEQIIKNNGPDQTTVMSSDVLAENIPKIEDADAMDRVITGAGRCVYYAFLDTRKIPLEVRRALATAWPIEQTNKISGNLDGFNWAPSTGLMPSVTPGYQKFDPIGNGGQGEGEPAKAKRMLEDAGELGFELKYYYTVNDPIAQKVNDVQTQAFEKAGFKVRAIPRTKEERRSAENDPEAPINMRTGSGWCPDWPSGGSVFPAQWDPRKIDLPGVTNPAFLEKQELVDRIDKISAMDPEKGLAEWGKLDKYIMEKYQPVVSLGQGDVTAMVGSRVGNAHIDTSKSMPDYTGMYVTD